MSPFFIVGVSRSGTTFLYHLLNAHPQFRLSYEGRLFTEGEACYRRYADLTNRPQFNSLLDDLIACDQHEPKNRWLGASIAASRDALFEQQSRTPSFASLIEQVYQRPGSAAGWGNKMLRLEMTDAILKHWPDAKFLVLVRDPRAVFASQKQKFPHRRLRYSGIYWNLHAEAIQVNPLPASQFMVIRYEDFVEAAAPSLERILRFAGLWDESVARTMLEAHPASSRSLHKWRTTLNEREIRTLEQICFDSMQRYGYTPERVDRGIRLGTVAKAVETVLDNRFRIPLRPSVWRQKQVWRRFLLTIRK